MVRQQNTKLFLLHFLFFGGSEKDRATSSALTVTGQFLMRARQETVIETSRPSFVTHSVDHEDFRVR